MKRYRFLTMTAVAALLAVATSDRIAGQAPSGKLILAGDILVFSGPGKPENCFMKNRFKRGEPVGFRITALDGATGEVEKSAQIVVHITYGGKTVDVPARYRGVPNSPGGTVPYLWTAKWIVPDDAPTGIVRWKAEAKDDKGRTTEWTQFQNTPPSQLTVIE
jgi:hypothetical protein